MGLLPTMSDAMRASAQPHGSTAPEAADVHEPPLVHCRQCAAWISLSTTRSLSTHRTSEGLVTYFRCPAGHADFSQTPAEPAAQGAEAPDRAEHRAGRDHPAVTRDGDPSGRPARSGSPMVIAAPPTG